MSHIVSIKTQMKDPIALAAACRRLGLAEPVRETVQLFSGQATGMAVRLPNWQYPVVIDVELGELHFDNFNGEWGESAALDRLIRRMRSSVPSWKRGIRATPAARPRSRTAASSCRFVKGPDMTTPRRRLLRPAVPSQPDHSLQAEKLRAKLDKDRHDLARWMSRPKRAFSFVQKHQQRIARLEKQIRKLQGA